MAPFISSTCNRSSRPKRFTPSKLLSQRVNRERGNIVVVAQGFQITFDAHDPRGLANFWATALGYEPQPPPPGDESWEAFADRMDIPADQREAMAAVVDPDGRLPRLLFIKVPEGKTAKNRVHLDIEAPGARQAAEGERTARAREHADRLVDAGATEIEERTEFGAEWIVMQDPEGNEFCVN